MRNRQIKKLARYWDEDNPRFYTAERVIERNLSDIRDRVNYWKVEYHCREVEKLLRHLPAKLFGA